MAEIPFPPDLGFYIAMKRTFVLALKPTWPQEIVYDFISREFPNQRISNAQFDHEFKEIRGNNVNT